MRQASDGVTGSGNKQKPQAGKLFSGDDDSIVAAAAVSVDGSAAVTERGDTLAAAVAIDGKRER